MPLSIECINAAREMRGLPPLTTSATPTTIAPPESKPLAPMTRQRSAASLVERYRPRTLSEVVGQAESVAVLADYASAPYSASFLLFGPSGVGKSSAALALAADLGCDVAQGEFGGVHQIASGEQTAAAVRALLDTLSLCPFFGSGWRVAIVNECDRMSPAAETIWLDALENLPPRCTIIFTTNSVTNLSDRFRDRTEELCFTGDVTRLKDAIGALLKSIWLSETGQADAPLHKLGAGMVRDGQVSIRRSIQALGKLLHEGNHAALTI